MSAYRISRVVMAAIIVIGGMAALASAAGPTARKIEISGDDIEGQPFTVEELGALVVGKGGELQVLVTMPGEHRLKVYRDVDLQENDRIMMVNGSKATSIDDLKEALALLKVGDEIKLGIKRGKDMKVISFPKADAADLPRVRRMMVTEGDEGDGPRMTMEGNGIAEDVTVLAGGGLIVRSAKDGPEIAFLMPDADEILGDANVQEGDRIMSLQGEAISDLATLAAAWDHIAIGDEVELVLSRSGKELTVRFARAEAPQGGMMMIKK